MLHANVELAAAPYNKNKTNSFVKIPNSNKIPLNHI